jgi:predicted kinase
MEKKNKEIILLCGIPAAGKSTWSLDYVTKNPNWIRLNRDDMRYMFKGVGVTVPKIEKLITNTLYDAVHKALNANLNVIVDQTNLKESYINEFIDEFIYKADISFRIFDISIDKAIERDSKRERKVGEEVIRKMNKDYLRLFDSFDFSTRKMKPRIITERFDNPTDLPKGIIFDMDGTLSLCNGKRNIFDWNRVDVDDVSETVRETLLLYKQAGYTIIIMSGRDSAAREKTEYWLKFYEIPYDELFMRSFNDMRKDSIVKKELYNNFVKDKYWIVLSVDDRNSVCRDVWRALGIKCYQVEDGNF